jgi:hypothetical protein
MSPDKIQFPSWLPPDAQRIFTDIYSVVQDSPFREAPEVLQRLAMRLEMKDAWAELKHFPNVSSSDLTMKTFVVWLLAKYNRLLREFPHFKSDHDDRELASMARGVTDALRTTDPAILAEANITDATLREMERVATLYERRAKNFVVTLRIAPPPTKARARNADQIAFVYEMCNWLGRKAARRRPYELVAILANVAFDVSTDRLWTADRVKQCLRSKSRKK